MSSNSEFPDPKEWIVVLGSGASINDIPDRIKKWANLTHARIGINKYGAFYKKAGIIPTDIYFHDFHNDTAKYFLSKTIKETKEKALKFYISSEAGNLVTTSKLKYCYLFIRYKIIRQRQIFGRLSRKVLKPISKTLHDNILIYLSKLYNDKPLYLNKKKEVFHVDVHYLWDEDNKWAFNLNDKLFHFRGSLTSVLNLASIEYPNSKILLLGVDLITKEYFFEEEINELFQNEGLGYDWSQPFMDSSGKHYSATTDKGVTIFDRFDYVAENLQGTGNKIYAYPEKNSKIFNGLVFPFNYVSSIDNS